MGKEDESFDAENPMHNQKKNASKKKTFETFEIEKTVKGIAMDAKQTLLEYVDEEFSSITKIETSVADVNDLPGPWKWGAFVIYCVAFAACGAIMFGESYNTSRTKSFISLDSTAGVCVDKQTSTECCEVPKTTSGTFLVDSKGAWDTMANFSYIDQVYGVTLLGLHYTNAQWADMMTTVDEQMKEIGKTRGSQRDFSWNLIAWASFTAINQENGYLQFYASGDVAEIFDKPIVNAGLGSAEGVCAINGAISFSASSRTMTVTIDLNTNGSCQQATSDGDYYCTNPCPSQLNPEAMGIPISEPIPNTKMIWDIDMASVTTAIAVNYGILSLDNLISFPGDGYRQSLFDQMNQCSRSYDNQYNFDETSSYYEVLYAPMNNIYCTKYAEFNESASCYLRVGNTLLYPYIVSNGYLKNSSDSTSFIACTLEAVRNQFTDASYYCNQFDIIVGFIYYPVAPEPSVETTTPSLSPTTVPTHFPTSSPTSSPTSPIVADDDNTYYYYSSHNDDGPPTDCSTIDNGQIFAIGQYAAKKISLNISNDIFIPTIAYNATKASLYGGDFGESFAELCSGKVDVSIPAGCAIFTVVFGGGNNRVINKFNFQLPSNPGPAYTKTLYNHTTMQQIIVTPPTILIENYFTCVMSTWGAVYSAGGLSAANSQLYVGLFIMLYMFGVVHLLRKCYDNQDVKWKVEKEKLQELEKARIRKFTLALMEDVLSGHLQTNKSFALLKTLQIEEKKEMEKAKEQGDSLFGFAMSFQKQFQEANEKAGEAEEGGDDGGDGGGD